MAFYINSTEATSVNEKNNDNQHHVLKKFYWFHISYCLI